MDAVVGRIRNEAFAAGADRFALLYPPAVTFTANGSPEKPARSEVSPSRGFKPSSILANALVAANIAAKPAPKRAMDEFFSMVFSLPVALESVLTIML